MLQFLCHNCGKSFVQKTSLVDHLSTCLPTDPHPPSISPSLHPCLACPSTFQLHAELESHVTSDHDLVDYEKLPQFDSLRCQLCAKTFLNPASLASHTRAHAKPRSFSCSRCAKVFAQKAHLAQHVRMHEGVRPFACARCGKAFAQKGALTQHERMHAGVKPFVCGQCGKGFAVRATLRQHENVPRARGRTRCEGVREERSHTKESLIVHARIHSGEKPVCLFLFFRWINYSVSFRWMKYRTIAVLSGGITVKRCKFRVLFCRYTARCDYITYFLYLLIAGWYFISHLFLSGGLTAWMLI